MKEMYAVERGVPCWVRLLIILPFDFGQRSCCHDHQWDSDERPCLCEHVLQSSGQMPLLVFRQRAVGTGGVEVERRELLRLARRNECRGLEG